MSDMNKRDLLLGFQSEDGQVWSIVLRIVLIALVVALLIIQCGPIIWNQINVHGIADDAAQEAAITYANNKGNMEKVYQIVQDFLDDSGARLEGSINVIEGKDGESKVIAITVRKIVNTYLFENVGYLCKYTEARAYSEYTIP